ncbi:hypothetical protein [Maledivibacter halophilus]|uniref:Uncharacterized protein n=1 Tax=Maledivibacter halophilus TaxID=36842 RepID=A0A1T5LBD2_9FIRM|nr:hypothetical protein [Maledivibacter halophilus]SKC73302.1 hypothetical protein SAMN02194393_02710 [Maledivibacter halophilus]
MENDYVEIIGKVFDIIDEAESKIVSKGSEERFNEEGYLLQKIHEDLIRLVGKAEKRYVEYQPNTY